MKRAPRVGYARLAWIATITSVAACSDSGATKSRTSHDKRERISAWFADRGAARFIARIREDDRLGERSRSHYFGSITLEVRDDGVLHVTSLEVPPSEFDRIVDDRHPDEPPKSEEQVHHFEFFRRGTVMAIQDRHDHWVEHSMDGCEPVISGHTMIQIPQELRDACHEEIPDSCSRLLQAACFLTDPRQLLSVPSMNHPWTDPPKWATGDGTLDEEVFELADLGTRRLTTKPDESRTEGAIRVRIGADGAVRDATVVLWNTFLDLPKEEMHQYFRWRSIEFQRVEPASTAELPADVERILHVR